MLKGMLSDVRYRLRALFRRAEMERELEEELRFHLEREAEKLLQAGVAPEEAMRRARVAFGGVERVKEESRTGRGTRWLDETATDVRHAGRLLGRSRGFAASSRPRPRRTRIGSPARPSALPGCRSRAPSPTRSRG